MAAEVRQFQVTVPAGTTAAAPLVSALTMPPRIVRGIRIRIPPGPRGVLGLRLTSSGELVVPVNAGAWLVADDEVLDWPFDQAITSGAWQLTAYNVGNFDHDVLVMFELDPVTDRGATILSTPLVITA